VGIVSEILTRSDGIFADIDFSQRLLDVIAVPWDSEARVFWRGDFWTEVFDRGAFRGIEKAAGKVRVNREHRRGDTVGKIVEFDPNHERGLFARVKIALGPKGDEVLHLASEDMISPSIGYSTKNPRDVILDKQHNRRRVMTAFLDHLGMVEDPAYTEARVLAVRGDGPSGTEAPAGPLPATPILDEFLSDPVFARILQRRS
jgi:HK97 family phage prohead protease